MMSHSFISPAHAPVRPFSIKVSTWGWVPGHYFYQDRDYYIVFEVARILRKRKIIRRISSTNAYGISEVNGVEQVRKWIREEICFQPKG